MAGTSPAMTHMEHLLCGVALFWLASLSLAMTGPAMLLSTDKA
jgi:hypothetical protein